MWKNTWSGMRKIQATPPTNLDWSCQCAQMWKKINQRVKRLMMPVSPVRRASRLKTRTTVMRNALSLAPRNDQVWNQEKSFLK